MSELKAYTYDDMIDGDADTNIEYYPKSEADKVIAEKDKELRRHKFKRCLAMARWCDTKGDWYYSLGEPFIDCVDFYIKWRDKWLKIADKFKEAK